MAFLLNLFVLINLTFCFVHILAEVPPELQEYICPRRPPPIYSACARRGIEALIDEYVTTGIPSLNIPILDPYVVKYSSTRYNLTNNINIEIEIFNSILTGVKDYQVQFLYGDPYLLWGHMLITTPHLFRSLEYRIKVNAFRNIVFDVKGTLIGDFYDNWNYIRGHLKQIRLNGKNYLQFYRFTYPFGLRDGTIKLTANTPATQQIATTLQNLFNANPPFAATIVSAITELGSNREVRDFLNRQLLTATAEEWLPR